MEWSRSRQDPLIMMIMAMAMAMARPGQAAERATVCYRCCCLPPSSKLCLTPKPKIPDPQKPPNPSRRRSAARPTISRQPLYTSTKTLSEHGGHDGCGGRRAEKKHVDTSLPNR
jgi:hypothetical protein